MLLFNLTNYVIFCKIKMRKGALSMLEEKIYLTAKDILEKEFKIDTRGYRPQEVDKFLDIIISDYTEYNKIIKRLETELRTIMTENERLKKEVRELRSQIEMASNAKGVTNVDILKRLSELEKIVYGE